VSLQIDGVDRQRLIQYRVPFVLPGFQAYLPDLLIDVREHFQSLRANQKPGRLTPSAQHFLLEAFYRRFDEIDRVTSLAPNANYSPMTRSRVISELEAAGLVETKQHGRHRRALITLPWVALWEKAHPLLWNPVRRRVHLSDRAAAEEHSLPRAGLSALAELSMLAAPRLPVYATVNRFSTARPEWLARFVTERADDARAELELWSYPPLIEKQPTGNVDRLSLYLSLQEDGDPRTQDALQKILKETL
jgi:DNA-binding MarR family transcriptional regulator